MPALEATFQVEGLQSLDAALRDLPGEVQKDVLGPALLAGGEVIRAAAASDIHSRTGKTAADLRVEVQVQASGFMIDEGGAAAIGGTAQGKGGRVHILRWLEFGTKPHEIPKRGRRRRTAKPHPRMPIGGGFASHVNHPGIAPQSPLTRALADKGEEAVQTFIRKAWEGIVAVAERLRATG